MKAKTLLSIGLNLLVVAIMATFLLTPEPVLTDDEFLEQAMLEQDAISYDVDELINVYAFNQEYGQFNYFDNHILKEDFIDATFRSNKYFDSNLFYPPEIDINKNYEIQYLRSFIDDPSNGAERDIRHFLNDHSNYKPPLL